MSNPDMPVIGSFRDRALWPGWNDRPANIERYRVSGGGCVTVPIFLGDQISLTDIEGAQPCEVVAFDQHWKSNPNLLSIKPNGSGEVLKNLLSSEHGSALSAKITHQKIDLSNISSFKFFGPDSHADEHVNFKQDLQVAGLFHGFQEEHCIPAGSLWPIFRMYPLPWTDRCGVSACPLSSV